MEKLIAMNGVGFGYPGQAPILSEVNLDIRPGEQILILGPNGSGKSTMALLICDLLTPTSGEINRFGKQPNIGIVFQNSRHQMVGSTVEDDLAFGLSLKSITATVLKKKVDFFLDKFNLESKRHYNINQLSGGELRRLALASVLITEPQILLLDEPLAMLDKENQVRFLDCLLDNILPETTLIWFDHEVRNIRHTKRWLVLTSKGQLNQVSLKELNSKAFLAEHNLTPAPLQSLEWGLPGRISDSIFGPERIRFD
jgi:energy-coupling factor transporter ATP-binding protein EcfA2